MLVKISYSIDFEDVPRAVRGFLQGDIKRGLDELLEVNLQNAISALEIDNENIGKTIKEVDEIREILVTIDARLSDCSNILRGFQKEILGLESQQQEAPTSENDLSILQQDLSALRNQLGEISNES